MRPENRETRHENRRSHDGCRSEAPHLQETEPDQGSQRTDGNYPAKPVGRMSPHQRRYGEAQRYHGKSIVGGDPLRKKRKHPGERHRFGNVVYPERSDERIEMPERRGDAARECGKEQACQDGR